MELSLISLSAIKNNLDYVQHTQITANTNFFFNAEWGLLFSLPFFFPTFAKLLVSNENQF